MCEILDSIKLWSKVYNSPKLIICMHLLFSCLGLRLISCPDYSHLSSRMLIQLNHYPTLRSGQARW